MGTKIAEARVRECTAAGLWRNESLETYLDRWATARPDKAAVVDGQEGVRDPIGMTAVRLEVETHIVTASSTSVQNLTKCVQRAGVEIDGIGTLRLNRPPVNALNDQVTADIAAVTPKTVSL